MLFRMGRKIREKPCFSRQDACYNVLKSVKGMDEKQLQVHKDLIMPFTKVSGIHAHDAVNVRDHKKIILFCLL
jgi:hypothetical protein